jgi:hypothetical protein
MTPDRIRKRYIIAGALISGIKIAHVDEPGPSLIISK